MPERGPEITGLSSSHYAVGENVTANCTVWPSVPKAALRWLINGKPVKTRRPLPRICIPPSTFFRTPGRRDNSSRGILEGAGTKSAVNRESFIRSKRNDLVPVSFDSVRIYGISDTTTSRKRFHPRNLVRATTLGVFANLARRIEVR